jgi:adenylylsulfate kinase
MILWLIGLSGVGKTTLADEVVRLARQRLDNIVTLDGDVLREVWGNDLGHTLADRRTNADRLCRLGAFLESQNVHAVCAILSLFEESRAWNREHLKNYYEVYIKTPIGDLARRDVKGLYARAQKNEIELPGVNMAFPEPERPSEIIVNSGALGNFLGHAPRLASLFQNDREDRR